MFQPVSIDRDVNGDAAGVPDALIGQVAAIAGRASESTDATAAGALMVRAIAPLSLAGAAILGLMLGFSRLSFGLVLPALRLQLGGPLPVFGALATVNFVGYFTGMLATPLLLGRGAQRRGLNLLAILMIGFGLIASAAAQDVWLLGALRGWIGLWSAPATVLTSGLVMERFAPQVRGRVSAVMWTGGAAGVVLSGLLTPLALTMGGANSWRVLWLGMGAAGVIAAIVFNRVLGNSTDAPLASASKSAFRLVLDPSRLLWLTLSYVFFGCGYILFFTFYVALLAQRGVPGGAAGYIWAGIGAVAMGCGAVWGKWIDRRRSGYVMAAALAIGAVGSALALSAQLPVSALGAVLMGIGAFTGPPLIITALVRSEVSDAGYAASFSAVTALFAIGQIFGPLMATALVGAFGAASAIVLASVFLSLGALAALWYGWVGRRRV